MTHGSDLTPEAAPRVDPVGLMTGRMLMAALRDDADALCAAWTDVDAIVERESADDEVPPFLDRLITDLACFAAAALLEATDGCESRAQDILLDHHNAVSG